MREREKVRAARRGVATEIADWMLMRLSDGVGDGLIGEDRERYEQCFEDIKDEMLRRADLEPRPRPVDERQRTLNEWLREEGRVPIG